MEMLNLTIDDRNVQASKGASVLEAAMEAGIFIPHLCYLEGLPPYNGCRLCIVEIEGMRNPEPACMALVKDGMAVMTNTPRVEEFRRTALLALLSENQPRCLTCLTCYRDPHCTPGMVCLRDGEVTERCLTCPKNQRCELQRTGEFINLRGLERFPGARPTFPLERNPLFELDRNRCILCARCVRVCNEIRGRGAIELAHRGSEAMVSTAFGVPLQETNCEFCGACVDVCPTASLRERSDSLVGLPDRIIDTICPYCGVGCGLTLEMKKETVVRSIPNRLAPVNKGQLCVKGRFGIDFVHHPARLTAPLIKRQGRLEKASWEEALGLVAERLEPYRGESFAAVSSARCTNEENYLFQKFTRTVMGSNNIDHCARL